MYDSVQLEETQSTQLIFNKKPKNNSRFLALVVVIQFLIILLLFTKIDDYKSQPQSVQNINKDSDDQLLEENIIEPKHDLEVPGKILENDQHQEEAKCAEDLDDVKLNLFLQYAKGQGKASQITPQDKLYLSYYLFKNPNDELGLKAEKYLYNKLYNIDKYKELPLCVTMVGYNKMETYSAMLETVIRQEYSNYKIVFIDDKSPPEVVNKIKNYVFKNVKQNITLVFNEQHEYAIKNRYKSIVDYCEEDDIILDIDSHDYLAGRQVFKLVNALYQRKPDTWVVTLNIFTEKREKGKAYPRYIPELLEPIPQNVLKNNFYRTAGAWKTTALRTYMRKLFMKIDPDDFKDENDDFFIEKHDTFIMYPLIEFSGEAHYVKENVFVYFDYFRGSKNSASFKLRKTLNGICSKMETPYQPLASLDDSPKRVEGYKIPEYLVKKYLQLKSGMPEFAGPKTVHLQLN